MTEVEGTLISCTRLLSLEEQDSAVAEVEVDEMLRLWCRVSCHSSCTRRRVADTMSDKASKVAAYDAVPCGTLSAVKLCIG